jgi:formylglycine-generating enzyme required for sulfatase activity/energy-coupling factor transporter ATP-binding protein EcfA2
MPDTYRLSDLRDRLMRSFDDAGLDAFCLDHFPTVFGTFGRGMRRDEKITLLLDHCRRHEGLPRLARLLAPTASPAIDPGALAAYLDAVRGDCCRLETRPYRQLSELRRAAPHLTLLGGDGTTGAYIPLRFDVHLSRATQMRLERRGTEVDEDLRLDDRGGHRIDVGIDAVLDTPGHVVLLGKAGSGKTTVLRLIAAVLAAQDAALAASHLGVDRDPQPVPVFIALREFEHACRTQPETYSRDVMGLLRFLDAHFQRRHPDRVPAGFVSDLVRSGRAWLLFDALDEVADFDHRIAVRQAIERLADAYAGNRLVVTARVAAYEHANTHLDARFNLATVRDLTREQWTALVHKLYAGLEPDADFAGRRADKLIARIDGAPTLQAMVRTPLMVWTATLIHYAERQLPEQRAELYAAYVDVLLGERLHEEEGAAAAQALRDARWPFDDRRLYLTYAAYKAHEGAAHAPRGEGGSESLVVVDETALVREILAPFMAETMMIDTTIRQGRRRARREARDFLNVMAERSGLLHAHPEGYTFGDHLTLQEFLAAHYLVRNLYGGERMAFLEAHVGESWWREVILLMAGSLLRQSRQAQRFLLDALGALPGRGDTHAYGLAWAGRALLEIPEGRVGWHRGVRAQLARRLVQVLRCNPPEASVAARVEAGDVLGALGDPRFAGDLHLPEFIPLPGGAFWMGSTEEEVARVVEETGEDWAKRELPRHRVRVDDFALAKYPATNAMFARFLEDGGYHEPAWWHGTPDDFWRSDGKVKDWFGNIRSRPRYWEDERLNGANQPVVGVSWYEAAAYCRWLTAALDDGYVYRLPTEGEWAYAARGSDGRCYAWGNTWSQERANTGSLGLERTTPVGLFPDGATPRGLLDITGNVWEWCEDWFDEDAYARRAGTMTHNPHGPERGRYKVLRGGSWGSRAPWWVRCASRRNLLPGFGIVNSGFRVARGSLP